ncbi:MAG: hypothetical protein IKW42_04885, partial [Alistipes sp.]|nr:hypothetical protein [Alistipes sp.]
MNHLISNNPHQVPLFKGGFRGIVNINIVLAHKHNEEVAQLDNFLNGHYLLLLLLKLSINNLGELLEK